MTFDDRLQKDESRAPQGGAATLMVRMLVIGFIACTIIGVFFATQLYLLYNYVQHVPLAFGRAVRSQLMTWYLWGLLAIVVVRLARRIPFDRDNIWRATVIHVPAAAVISLIHILFSATWFWGVEGAKHSAAEWMNSFRFMLFVGFHWDVLTYASILAFVHAWDYYRRYRDRELQSARLESQLAQARLGALEMQLHPHFLFNTLNAIATLIHEDAHAADLMLTRLSDLLRMVLRRKSGQSVALEQEIEFVRKYLEIEQVRFQDRLEVRWQIDPAVRGASVPNLILQPLVENAVRHGAARIDGPCVIEIIAGREGNHLIVEIVDSGPGVQSASVRGQREGMGLSNTHERLEQLFGRDFSLDLRDGNGGGCRARLSIPFCPAPIEPESRDHRR